jgi:alpha-ketoglutarate-dependent 2,4-dichlorophenoxyacetate dioxygenase
MRLESLHPDFGVEVKGVSIMDVATSEDAYDEVRQAFETHSVLVWRGQDVAPDGQVAFTRSFGPLEISKAGITIGTLFGMLTNIGPDGALVPEGHAQLLSSRANQLWHTDSSFKPIPALASALRAIQVPPSGGETEFASMRTAWERLGDHERALLDSMTAVHSWATSRSKIDPSLPSRAEQDSMPPVRWRLTWENPHNRRKALYLASHIGAIEGMDQREATELLSDLTARATQRPFTYLHRWQAGDVVLWDNRATMHRGRPWNLDSARRMVRTTASVTRRDGLASVTPAAVNAAPAAVGPA